MDKSVLDNYKFWSTDPFFDEDTRKELLSISSSDDEITERFYKGLEFGTGGLRGVIGAGLNRMNIYTVGKATQGVCNYIKSNKDIKDLGVAVAYDSRNMSFEFALEVCLVMNANGFKSYIFDKLMPTPVLSYATRKLGLSCGVMITASHNPKEYNGYKLFWSDGCQVPPPMDTEIIDYVNDITDFRSIKTMSYIDAKQSGLYNDMPKSVYEGFMEECLCLMANPDLVKQKGSDMSIIYTPLHGTGNLPVRDVLNRAGFSNVFVVKEQEMPDSTFPSVPFPNPEDFTCYELGVRDAFIKNADIVLATDPDCDRIGVAVKNTKNEFKLLTGNQTGALVLNYLLESGKAKPDGAIVKTIVSSRLIDDIANKYDQSVFNVLTGFKYIGQKIFEFERDGSYSYIMGMEESFGMLLGTHARDKDAVSACLLVSEMALYYKQKNMSLLDALNELYEEFGYYNESAKSFTLKGIKGMEIMKDIMAFVRNNHIYELAGHKVSRIYDYLSGDIFNVETGKTEKSELPEADVFLYECTDGTWFCIRPSGTEPKIKLYTGIKAGSMEESVLSQEKLLSEFSNMIPMLNE